MGLMTKNLIGFFITMIPFIVLAVWILVDEAKPGNHHMHIW